MAQVLPADAHKLMGKGWKLLDVRPISDYSRSRVPGSINVPYMYGGKQNKDFLATVKAMLSRNDRIIVTCATARGVHARLPSSPLTVSITFATCIEACTGGLETAVCLLFEYFVHLLPCILVSFRFITSLCIKSICPVFGNCSILVFFRTVKSTASMRHNNIILY